MFPPRNSVLFFDNTQTEYSLYYHKGETLIYFEGHHRFRDYRKYRHSAICFSHHSRFRSTTIPSGRRPLCVTTMSVSRLIISSRASAPPLAALCWGSAPPRPPPQVNPPFAREVLPPRRGCAGATRRRRADEKFPLLASPNACATERSRFGRCAVLPLPPGDSFPPGAPLPPRASARPVPPKLRLILCMKKWIVCVYCRYAHASVST